nr:VOC family protein [Rubrobacter sp.]
MSTGIGWQGFHHVALVTADLDATLRFYEDVLGMEAGEIMG